jgi:hypothetical protein
MRFSIKNIFSSTSKNALAYYNAGVVVSRKFKSRRIGSWIQTYDHELQSEHIKYVHTYIVPKWDSSTYSKYMYLVHFKP